MYLTLYLAAIYDKDLKPSFESFAKNNSLELFNDILRLFDGKVFPLFSIILYHLGTQHIYLYSGY